MPTRSVGRYRLTRQLGVGMFAKVMVGVDDDTGEEFAVKIMRKESLEDMEMARYARREAAVMRKVSHPSIVELVEAIQSQSKLFLVMRIAPGKELLDVVADGPLRESVARRYMNQLVDAVAYLHRKGVVHRDLKPENVIIDRETGTLKLIDFGLTGIIRHDSVMTTSCGSNFYSAPEVTFGNGAGYDGVKADAWSLGILCYIMLTGSHPFVDADGELMTSMMRQGTVEYPDYLSRGSIHFMSRLLVLDQRRRYSVAQASLLPWLTGRPVPAAKSAPSAVVAPVRTVAANSSDRQHPDARENTAAEEVDKRDKTSAAGKRPGTFTGGNHHRNIFGRNLSERSFHSSASLAMRRQSSQKGSSSSFLWFRRQNSGQDVAEVDAGGVAGDDENAEQVAQTGVAPADRQWRRGSIDITASDHTSIAHDASVAAAARPKVSLELDRGRLRRQLSLSSRTRALLSRGASANG